MKTRIIIGLGIATLLAACGEKAPSGNEAAPITPTPVDMPANVAEPAPTKGPDLSAYVGKYPFDKVDGVTFLDQPAVRAAVEATVADKAIRRWIFDDAGPQTPIVSSEGALISYGCETHNCGPHNWAVLFKPAEGTAEVCYFDGGSDDDADAGGKSDWYLPGGKTEQRDGSCPSE